MQTIGNLWADLYRTTVYLLLPLSFVFALVLVSQGVIQRWRGWRPRGPHLTYLNDG
ncbi:MAG: potassium-transporting ATPase subunit KdpA [Gammaproteobacteria bacterium]